VRFLVNAARRPGWRTIYTMDNASHALRIAGEFDLGGTVAEVLPHGNGLINDTYRVKVEGGRDALLQRLNTQVFPHPEWILDNLRALLDHAARQDSHDLQLPALCRARDGRDYVTDNEGGFWRALEFIPHTRSLATLGNPGQAHAVGLALARFHRLLHDLPVNRLHTTLPGFHITPEYLRHFDDVLQDSVTGHSIALRDALEFVEEHRELAGVLERARTSGELILRPTHGDPKLDNFLFDRDGGQVVALIDLDTVQPGLVQVDVADCLRSCCNRAGESPADLFAVRLDLDLAGAILRGYLTEAREFLDSTDYEHLYDAIRLIPFELGLRFLTDHFAGDVYFKVAQPRQNLLRARAQFRLTEDIERHEGALRRLIESLATD
jgi:Ser/Thr protein kinase RdoA (MazF antagonist)